MISLLIALSCRKPVPLEPFVNDGKIGVQYRRVDDWMLVTQVVPGMPAEAAEAPDIGSSAQSCRNAA